MIEQYELRRNETQITIRDPFTLCLTFKKQLWYLQLIVNQSIIS